MNARRSYRYLDKCPIRGYRTVAVKSRRHGQALLMAVLLMVFAALLGSTFVTVVALNLNQTTRSQDRSSAQTATQAAMLYANKQIVTSVSGEKWRPEMVSPPPYMTDRLQTGSTTSDPDYNVYYTPFERAQGWARTIPRAYAGESFSDPANLSFTVSNGDWDHDGRFDKVKDDWAKLEYFKDHIVAPNTGPARVLVKFPDPRLSNANTSTPTFLIEVKFVNATDVTSGAESNDKLGELRITAIGEAEDNPNVFVRRVNYKSTNSNGGPLAWFLYASNWNSARNRVVATRLTAQAVNGDSTITVNDISGITVGRQFVMHDPAVAKDSGFQVTGIGGSPGAYTLTITPSISGLPLGSQYRVRQGVVRAAGTLMGTLRGSGDANPVFDADADSTNPAADSTSSAWEATLPTSANPIPNFDATVSNGLYLNGGLWLPEKTQLRFPTTVGAAKINVAGGVDQSGIFTVQHGTAAPGVATAQDVNEDPNQTNTGAGITVRPLSPPQIDDKSSRYLELTKYADSSVGSPFGYGPGVYIDNIDDVEKIASATPGSFRAIVTSDLQRLWQRKSFPTKTGETGNLANPGTNAVLTGPTGPAYRLAYPRATDTYIYPAPTGSQASLEQLGIRGWVTPQEYRPRGVLIELKGDLITITRDDRADTSPTAPDANKAWRDTSGALTSSYTMTIDTSHQPTGIPTNTNNTRVVGTTSVVPASAFNGVIYAEGNVRIRGKAGSQDLTIVSMGNIYIEGNLVRNGTALTDGRIALLAKKNVVLNPTRFISRLDTDTLTPLTALQPVSGQNTTLFPNSNPRIDQHTNEVFYRLANPAQPAQQTGAMLARDIYFDAGSTPTGNYFLSVQHAGEPKPAFTIDLNGGTTPGSSVTSKQDTSPDGLIDSTEKVFAGVQTSANFTKDLLNFSGAGTPDDTTERLTALSNEPEFTGVNRKWSLTLDTTDPSVGNFAARRIAKLSFPAIETATTALPVPLTVSMGLFWLPGQTTPPVPLATKPNVPIGSSYQIDRTGSELVPTVDESFYWHAKNTTPALPNNVTTDQRVQAYMNWANYQLTTFGAVQAGDNLVQFQPDPNVQNLPAYRLGAMRLERGTGTPAAPFQVGPFASPTSPVAEQAIDIQVQATVYAQDGSWFVIPAPLTAPIDANYDGSIDVTEQAATTHYRRPNYRITFAGTIAQNYMPTADVDTDSEPNPDGSTAGAMRQWMDSLAYPTTIENATGGTPAVPRGKDWGTIQYNAVALPPANTNLYLPVSPDLSFTS